MTPKQFVLTLAKHGSFDDETLMVLARHAIVFEKNASAVGSIGTYLKGVAPHVIGILGASAVSGMIGYSAASKRYDELNSNLQYSHRTMLHKHKAFLNAPEEFAQRFNELSLISPTVAANPDLAHKVIEPKLNSGFNLEDIHRLAAIEHHSTTTRRAPHPLSVLTSESLEGVKKVIDFMAPTAIQFSGLKSQLDEAQRDAQYYEHKTQEGQKLVGELAKKYEETHDRYNSLVDAHKRLRTSATAVLEQREAEIAANKVKGQEKKGSMEQHLSDECIGVMIADRYIMYKKAGLIKSAGAKSTVGALGQVASLFKPSVDAIKNHFQVVAIPLALGMGIQAVRQLMAQRETASLRAQAQKSFDLLSKQNDYVKANPELANEAFDALRSFAPTLAAKPLIAKTFIEHVIKTEQLGPQSAMDLANSEEKVRAIAETAGGGSFMAGLQEPLSVFKFKMPGEGKGLDAETVAKALNITPKRLSSALEAHRNKKQKR